MKYYRIDCLSVSGAGKLIHRSQNVVAENQFKPGDIDKYLADGAISETKKPQTEDEVDLELEALKEDYLQMPGAKAKVPKSWNAEKIIAEIAKLEPAPEPTEPEEAPETE